MTVFRDSHGIPHVRAESVTRLAFEQGRVTAGDRAWQLEIERLRAEGRTAGLLGAAGLEWDVFARRAGIADVARRAFAGLDDESRAFVTAYSEGVNAAWADGVSASELDALGTRPGGWEPWTPLGVFLVQHILFGTLPSKLWKHRVAATVGHDALRLLRTEGLSGGSNALAVGPGRTAHGHPIIGGDPHRLFEAPNVYQQVRLACPEFDVVGFTFPGVPGVQHFAHAGDVAWAITNAVADYQDVYVERLARRDGGVWASGPQGWEPTTVHHETVEVRDEASVEVEVVVTTRGPVVVGGPDEAESFSLRTPSHLLGDLGFDALLPLLRSRTVADVDAALDLWVEPVNNVVIADRHGTVRHRVAGKVPLRPAGRQSLPVDAPDDSGWIGWVTELPRSDIPRDGAFGTANDRGSAAYTRIGDEFAPPFRADRIRELLAGQARTTAADVIGVLADTRQNAGQVLLRIIRGLDDLSGPASGVRDELLAWDHRMTADGPGAARFAAVRERVVARICAAEPLSPLHGGSPFGELYDPWFSLPVRVAASLHVILSAEAPFGLEVRELVSQSLSDAAGDPLTWGDRHVFHPLHALHQFGLEHAHPVPETPLPGDSDAVFATGVTPGTRVCVRGPVARYVWDLADRDNGGWVVPLGAAGDPASVHHHDQHSAWASGGVVPLVTDWTQLTEEPP
jgi:penicillin amidase